MWLKRKELARHWEVDPETPKNEGISTEVAENKGGYDDSSDSRERRIH